MFQSSALSVLYSFILIELLQIRGGRKPDGVCLVVGSCCRGFGNNVNSDIIYSSASVKEVGETNAQYFWEVIPFYWF